MKDRTRPEPGGSSRLKGWATIVLSVVVGIILGAVFAQGGIGELQVLTGYSPAGSGAVLGFLAGLLASGGKALITGIQINGANARARAQAKYECPAPTSAPADEWEPAGLEDLAPSRPL